MSLDILRRINPFDYIKPGAVLTRDSLPASNETDNDALVEEGMKVMGFFKTDSGWKHTPSITTEHLLSCITLVRCLGEFYLFNIITGIFELAEPILPAVIISIIDQYALLGAQYSVWNSRLVQCITAEIKMRVLTQVETFDRGPFIVLRNGVYDTESFCIKPFNPKHLASKRLNFNYNPNSSCKRFEQFIDEICCGDKSLALLLQQMVGYCCLANHNRAEAAFILLGSGMNGKSTLAHVMKMLAGEGNVSATPLSKFATEFGLQDVADKRMNITTESEKNEAIPTSVWKALVSGDSVSINPKGKARYTASLAVKIVSFMNYAPSFGELDKAVKRRLIMIPLVAKIDKPDPYLSKKLDAEIEGIFLWAIEGLKILQENNWEFKVSPECEALVHKLAVQTDPLLSFLTDYIVPSADKSLKLTDIREKYNKFAYENGYGKAQQKGFSDAICRKLEFLEIRFTQGRTNGYATFKGICFKPVKENNHVEKNTV